MSRGLNKPFRINLENARTGQGERIPVSGKFIRAVDASSAAAECQIALIGDFNTTYFRFVELAKLYEGQMFDGIYVKNDAQPGEWIEIVITDGPEDFDYERPTNNNIGQIVSDVKVINGSVSPLSVNSASADAKLDAILAMLQNPNDQRKGLTDLSGASHAIHTAASTAEIVSAAANVNGVIIRRAECTTHGTSRSILMVDGKILCSINGNAATSDSTGVHNCVENIFVPPGLKIEAQITSASAGRHVSIWYEVL